MKSFAPFFLVAAVFSVSAQATHPCSALVQAHQTAPGIQTQIEGGYCGPVCTTNAVVSSLHALHIDVPFAPDEQVKRIKYIWGTYGLSVAGVADAIESLYRLAPQSEATLSTFSARHQDRPGRGRPFSAFQELTAADLLEPAGEGEVVFTILGVLLTSSQDWMGLHAMTYFGPAADGFFHFADPRGGKGTFRARLRPVLVPRFGYENNTKLPELEPEVHPPVFDHAPPGTVGRILNGVRVRVRRRP